MKSLVVFLGPTLPVSVAREIVDGEFLPPARQGDVWNALERKPRVIALIDGVFEAQPSVWHREILTALSEGVAVFGASSMGALRAAELSAYGMIGVGEIFHRYDSGEWNDDSDVALLHASAEHEFRPLTVPLVNVRFAAEEAVREGLLSKREAKQLVEVSSGIFYQERTWDSVLRALPEDQSRAAFDAWRRKHPVDLKARDATECLRACDAFLRSGAEAPRVEIPVPSSLVRRTRLHDEGGPVLRALQMQHDAKALTRDGGMRVIAETLGDVLGVQDAEWIAEAPWRLADGPDPEEAMAREARRTGRWDALVNEVGSARSPKQTRRK